MQELGHNAYRFSLEWSRIEPQEGVFDTEAITRYRSMLEACRARGITSVVTLHHFTNPQWFAARGGWTRSSNADAFVRYASHCLDKLGGLIDLLITINEPQVYAFMSYQLGAWPPQHRSHQEGLRVMWNMAKAHKRVYKLAKTLFPSLPVGIAYNMTSFAAEDGSWLTRAYARICALGNNHLFYWMTGYVTHDFFGVNYYFHRRLRRKHGFIPEIIDPKELGKPVSDLGWELFAEGVVRVLEPLTRHRKPILITEHGLADADDSRRPQYLKESVAALMQAKAQGIPLMGYLHWSLLDNFEWADGFGPRFGLVAVEYGTQKRTPRRSAYMYRDLIQIIENG